MRAQDRYGVIREKERRGWYDHYVLQVARLERAYGGAHDAADGGQVQGPTAR